MNDEWYFWDLESCPDHDENERCPRCGAILKEDRYGGFYLKCPRCGWSGW